MKSKGLSHRFYLSFLVSVSLFGLFLVTLPAVFPLPIQEDLEWRKPLIGSVFGLICFLGIIAVFFPGHCSTIFQAGNTEDGKHAKREKEDTTFQTTSTILGVRITHGHHPSCEGFAPHEFQIGRKTLCTACMGLLWGASVTLFGVAAYFFLGWNIGENASSYLLSGVFSVGLGLLQYAFFDVRWRFIRFLLNVLFVFGTFLVLIGVDTAANSLIFDFFVVFLAVFWLFTRILLSKHIHNRVCLTCSSKCEIYRA